MKKGITGGEFIVGLLIVIVTGVLFIIIINGVYPDLFGGVMNTIFIAMGWIEGSESFSRIDVNVPKQVSDFQTALAKAMANPEKLGTTSIGNIITKKVIESRTVSSNFLRTEEDYNFLIETSKTYGHIIVQYYPQNKAVTEYENRIALLFPEKDGVHKDKYLLRIKPLKIGEYNLHISYYIGDKKVDEKIIPVIVRQKQGSDTSSTPLPPLPQERIIHWKITEEENTIAEQDVNEPSISGTQLPESPTITFENSPMIYAKVDFSEELMSRIVSAFYINVYAESSDHSIAVLDKTLTIVEPYLWVDKVDKNQKEYTLIHSQTRDSEILSFESLNNDQYFIYDTSSSSRIALKDYKPDTAPKLYQFDRLYLSQNPPQSDIELPIPLSPIAEKGYLRLELMYKINQLQTVELPFFTRKDFKWFPESKRESKDCIVEYSPIPKDGTMFYNQEPWDLVIEQVSNDISIQPQYKKATLPGTRSIIKGKTLCVVGGNMIDGTRTAESFYKKFKFGQYAPIADSSISNNPSYTAVRHLRIEGTNGYPKVYLNEEKNTDLYLVDYGLAYHADNNKLCLITTTTPGTATEVESLCHLSSDKYLSPGCLKKARITWKNKYPKWADKVFC